MGFTAVFFGVSGTLWALPAVTIKSTGTNGPNTPVTFAQVFKPGDVPAGTTLSGLYNGVAIPLQVDVKATNLVNPAPFTVTPAFPTGYPSPAPGDGSLRHAVITALLPSVGAANTLMLVTGGAPPAGNTLTITDLLNTGYDAVTTLDVGGTIYKASARAILQAGAASTCPGPIGQGYCTWLKGPLVTEFLMGDAVTTAGGTKHPHLTVYYHVRFYKGGRVRTDVVVENNWTFEPNPSNQTYNATISINGSQVYAYSFGTIPHYHHARWRQQFWTGGTPAVHIEHDPQYLIASGAVPNYDPALIGNVDATVLPQTFPANPMDRGLVAHYMPTTGAARGIGILPQWASLHLLGQSAQAKNVTLGMGDLGGSWSVHYRDRTTGLPVSIDDYPLLTTDKSFPITPSLCPTGGSCATPFVHDTAHQPSFAYVPYLVTGDYFHIEELQFWATLNFVGQNPSYRGNSEGQVGVDQVRGQAWSMRTLGHTAYITPDTHPLKNYFNQKLQNNIANYVKVFITRSLNGYGAMAPNNYDFPIHSPWMDDFFTSVMGVLVEIGYNTARPVRDWKAKFPVQRMGFDLTNPTDFCWNYATQYRFQAALLKSDPMFPTIKDVYINSTSLSSSPCGGQQQITAWGLADSNDMIGGSNSATGYPSDMQPALAMAADSGIAGAANAWNRFDARSVKPNYSTEPQFAIVPRTTPIGGGSTNPPPPQRPTGLRVR
jgi:hypothetical protein